jgi:hypothetical protein
VAIGFEMQLTIGECPDVEHELQLVAQSRPRIRQVHDFLNVRAARKYLVLTGDGLLVIANRFAAGDKRHGKKNGAEEQGAPRQVAAPVSGCGRRRHASAFRKPKARSPQPFLSTFDDDPHAPACDMQSQQHV